VGAQLAEVTQDVVQSLLAHTYGVQSVVPFAWQVPLLSQVEAFVRTELLAHDDGLQTVPCSEERQLPAPLHTPSPRQTPVPWVPHSLSGSAPLGM
jgi:hypothetical protein